MLLRAAGICVLKPWTLTLFPEQNLIPFEMRAVFRMNGLLLLAEKKLFLQVLGKIAFIGFTFLQNEPD